VLVRVTGTPPGWLDRFSWRIKRAEVEACRPARRTPPAGTRKNSRPLAQVAGAIQAARDSVS
jgi:hypothetical protein